MQWNAIRKRLFFSDAPAQGAFYALTQLLLGSYLLFSLLVFLLGIGRVTFAMSAGRIAAGAVVLLLFCYYLYMTLTFFRSQQSGFQRYLSWLYFVLWGGLLLWGYFRLSLPGVWAGWLFAFFFTGVLPLFFCARQWKPALGSLLAWCVGSLMLLLLWSYYQTIFFDNESLHFIPSSSTQVLVALSRFPGISGWGWSVWAAVGLLFLALWYWLTALFFARLSGVKKSSLFGKGVIVWWGAGAAAFLLFTILTCFAGKEVSLRIAELEERFGRPLTAEALAECYFNGRKPDAAFWERWEKNQEAVSPLLPIEAYPALSSIPSSVRISADKMKQLRNHFKQHNAVLAEWEAQFADPLPPRPRQYRSGSLIKLLQQLPELNGIHEFNRLQLWRIHFALTDEKIDEALAAERRMKQGNQYPRQDPFMASALVWASCEELRLSGIEMLLESGKLPESVLHRIAAELAEQEKVIPPLLERISYSEAVQALDFCEFMKKGEFLPESESEDVCPASPVALRCFVPQLWWYFRREMAELARICNTPDIHHADMKQEFRSSGILASMIAPDYSVISRPFLRLTARLRAVRGLIQAELHRQKHGSWPESLPDLLLDPYSGKPLLYRKGECLLNFTRLDSEPPHRILPEIHSIPAIQVWSVGPDGVDDGGFRPDGSHCDDVRALLRLRPAEK